MQFRVPDALCIVRALLAPALFLMEPMSDCFLAFYAFLWATDILDGFIARKTGKISPNGQVLDSAADAVLASVMLLCVVPDVDWQRWMIAWMGLIIVIRLVSLGIGTGRHGHVAFVHTWLNKLAGLLIFTMPFLLRFFDLEPVAIILGTVTTASALEYFYINMTSEELDRDEKSAFLKHRHN